MSIFLAGRFAVEVDGEPADGVGLGNLGRVAFAYLVLERHRQVSRDELAEALWGDGLPATWEAALRSTVSRVRALLANAGLGDAVASAFGCYQVRLPEHTVVDVEAAAAAVDRAEALVTTAPEVARSAAREAVTTSGLRFLPGAAGWWAERRQEQLADLRVRALEALAESAQACGDPVAAVAAAEQAVALQPVRESAHLRLMEALAAAGNRGSALRAYERCRLVLAQELGVAPSARVETAYLRLLGDAHTPARPVPAGAPSNLPASLTSFVGRHGELADVRRLLASTRLLTLTGPGGVGKSRLALEVAASLLPHGCEGVWLAELAGLTDPALVAHQALSALGAGEAPGASPIDSLVRHVGGRHIVLVLDNCEHLIAACATLADTLLRACPGLTILATSREPLAAVGETSWTVPPLSTPGADGGSREELLDCEAVRLFVERSGASAPGMPLDADVVSDIGVICRRLDGMPLAIELAAARARALSVREICHRLDDRFGLLVGGPRTAPARHQTLRATIDWSYGALGPEQRRLFAWLSVFAGGFSLDAAEAVYDRGGVMDSLTGLVDQSLVIADRSGTTTRYRVLETLRQYGKDRLIEMGELDPARDRHLGWGASFAATAARGIDGSEQAAALALLEGEHDNLRTALDHAAASEAGGRLAASLGRFWEIRGHLTEGRARLAAWLDRGEGPAGLRGQVLTAAAVLAQRQHDWGAARAWYEESLVISRALDDPRRTTTALHGVANMATMEADFETAAAMFEENLVVARTLGDRRIEAASLMNLGVVHQYLFMRRLVPLEEGAPRARAFYRQSLAAYTELGDTHGMALALENLGALAPFEGDRATSRSCHTESLRLRRQVGDKLGIAASTRFLAGLAFWDGDYDLARNLNEECLTIHRELGNRARVAEALGALADVARIEGANGEARRLLSESLELHRHLDDRQGVAWTLCSLGQLAVMDRDFPAAHRALDEARGVAAEVGNERAGAWALAHLATLARAQADQRTVAARSGEALALAGDEPHPMLLATLADAVAGLAQAGGDHERAARLAGAANGLRHPPGARPVVHTPSVDDERFAEVMERALGAERSGQLQTDGEAMSPPEVQAAILETLAVMEA